MSIAAWSAETLELVAAMLELTGATLLELTGVALLTAAMLLELTGATLLTGAILLAVIELTVAALLLLPVALELLLAPPPVQAVMANANAPTPSVLNEFDRGFMVSPISDFQCAQGATLVLIKLVLQNRFISHKTNKALGVYASPLSWGCRTGQSV